MAAVEAVSAERAGLIRNLAEEVREIARKNMQIELKYDYQSIQWLTGYIDRMRSGLDAKATRGFVNMIGSFLGECLIRNVGGSWVERDGMVCVQFGDSSIVFPFIKVAKQVENGSAGGDSIAGFYQAIAAMRATTKPPSALQQRLLTFHAEGGNCLFIMRIVDTRPVWRQVMGIKDGWVDISDSESPRVSVPLTQIESFYVCAPDGKLLHTDWIAKNIFDTLPPDIMRQMKSKLPTDTSLTLDQLESGKKFIAVEYAKSSKKKDGYHFYSTSLRNISDQKLKILKFGGLRPNGKVWTLASVTAQFYTADNFRDWYEQKGEWLLPGETACDAGNWGSPPVLWAYYGVTESGESFIAGACIERPIEEEGGNAAAGTTHYLASMPAQPAMELAISRLRDAYAPMQKRLNPNMLKSICASAPRWMNEGDALNEVLRQLVLLLTEGSIVWGALIQANQQLFEPGQVDCPALLVHAGAAYFDARPMELATIGRKIFGLKGTNPADPALKAVAQLVTDEMDRSMGFKLPAVFSSEEISAAAFMVFRKHIPNGVLTSGIFPILTHPSTQAVMIVPFEFWPIEMIMVWKKANG